eukprot:COSAG01_NODE_4930_length_4614_cov_2.538206_2_plen_229_part_00
MVAAAREAAASQRAKTTAATTMAQLGAARPGSSGVVTFRDLRQEWPALGTPTVLDHARQQSPLWPSGQGAAGHPTREQLKLPHIQERYHHQPAVTHRGGGGILSAASAELGPPRPWRPPHAGTATASWEVPMPGCVSALAAAAARSRSARAHMVGLLMQPHEAATAEASQRWQLARGVPMAPLGPRQQQQQQQQAQTARQHSASAVALLKHSQPRPPPKPRRARTRRQ